jgi:pyridoxamine 5'-phosphate oxidase family protein
MTVFSRAELTYLAEAPRERLARIATVGPDGTPHVVPVGFTFDPDRDTIDIGGFDLEATKKWRDIRAHDRAAVVVDDLAEIDPWRPRGIEIRGRAELVPGDPATIRLHPERIVSWGLESDAVGERSARNVG